MESESVRFVMGSFVVASLGGIGIYRLCRYVIGPLVGYGNAAAIQKIAEVYERSYARTIEERAKMVVELAKDGRTPQDITEYLDVALPLPSAPEPQLIRKECEE